VKALLAPRHALQAFAAVSRWKAQRWAAVTGDASATEGQAGAAPDTVSMLWRLWYWLAASLRDERRLAWAIVLGLVTLDGVLVGQHVLARHLTYHSDAFDLGNMDQAVWNTLHGHFFRFTNRGIDWYGPPTRLAIHVEPILLLIAPLYLIHSGAETLLVLQTVALALGAVPLFALALRRLPDLPLVCVGFVVAYLAAPELLGEALWDFHPVTLATPLLLAAFYALDARRYGWFLAVGILAAACKEDVALALAPVGLLIALRQGRPRLGLVVAGAAVVWTALCFLVIIPHFNAGASVSGSAYWYRYTALGSTPADALRRVIAQPRLLLTDIFAGDKLGYLALLLRTGGGLGIFAPVWWLAALPELAINLLSAQPPQYSGFYHYNAVLLAVLLVAAVYGTETLRRARVAALTGAAPTPLTAPPRSLARAAERIARGWTARIGRLPIAPRLIGPIVVVWLLVATGWNLAAVGAKLDNFWQAGAAPAPYRAQIDALLQRIPAGATVAATDTLDPHLSDRETIYLLPDPESYRAQYVAADVATVPVPWRGEAIAMLSTMADSGRYRVVGVAGPVVVLERVGPPLEGG
jgi:uncharacterized membrane protein